MLNKTALVTAWATIFLFVCRANAGVADDTILIKDALGQSIRVSMPVTRIVALNSDVMEIIRALKAEEMVVGVFSEMSRNKAFWGKLADKPHVGSWREVNMEKIVALSPDVVIAYERNPGPELEKKLSPFGIQVLRLNFYKIKSLEQEIRDLGKILQRNKEAALLCDWYRKCYGIIQSRLQSLIRKPSVYVESYSDYHAGGPGSGANQMCVLAGGLNIASASAIPYPKVTPEWVVSQNPDIIIKGASRSKGYEQLTSDVFDQLGKTIMERPVFKHINAVKQGRVHVMDSSIWTGPRAIIGIAYLVKWFHPDIFTELSPEALHREYFTKFQGIPFKGHFVSKEELSWK